MKSIDVEGLPEQVARALEGFVRQLRQQLSPTATQPQPVILERLKKAFGTWSDSTDEEFSQWQHEMKRSRQMSRPELSP